MALSRRLFISSLAPLAVLTLRADEKEPTFSSDVRVVNVLATVRDKSGRIVKDLKQEDFTLTEDGRAQTIRYFSRETDLPLTLGLLVDTSMSQRRVLGEEKSASFRFLDKVLRAEKDRTFVIHFDHDTELLQDLTSSRPLLQKALDELELPAEQRGGRNSGGGSPGGNQGGGNRGGGGVWPGSGGIGFPGGMGGGRRGGGYPRQGGGGQGGGRGGQRGAGTTLYDAILLASDDIMKKEKGRKALILLTDGVDNGSKTFLNDAVEAAQRADTLVYSILFSDESAYSQLGGRRGGGGHEDGRRVLERISRETGGTFYEVSKKLPLDTIYDQLQEELRNQYSIGYTSDAKDAAGYKAIRLTTSKSGLVVQTREGYYSR